LANAELISLVILRELRVKTFLINYRYLMASGIHQNFFDSECSDETQNLASPDIRALRSEMKTVCHLEIGMAMLSLLPVNH
jgi:hypothetical protein